MYIPNMNKNKTGSIVKMNLERKVKRRDTGLGHLVYKLGTSVGGFGRSAAFSVCKLWVEISFSIQWLCVPGVHCACVDVDLITFNIPI